MSDGISIRTRLLFLVVAGAISLAASVGYGIYTDMHQTIDATKASLRTLAITMVGKTGGKIANARQTLERLAERPLVKLVDAKQCDDILKELLYLNPDYANATYTTREGVAVCSAVPQPGGKQVNVGKAPWFQRFVKNQHFTVGEPFFGPITGKWVSVLSAPIWNEQHELVGGVQFPFDLNAYDPQIPTQFLPAGTRYGFVSEGGILVWRNADPEGEIGKRTQSEAAQRTIEVRDGEFESTGSDGVSRYYAVVPMPETGWVAFVGVPVSAIYADARQRALSAVLLALAGICLLLLLSFLVAHRIVRPVALLEKTARALHGGNLGARMAVTGPSEVVEVAKAFNAMADSVQAYTVRLEAEVEAHQRAEELLRESKEDLSITLNAIGDGVIATDAEGRVTRMNPTAERLCGWVLDDAKGQPLPDVFRIVNATTRATVVNPVELVMAHGQVVGLANHTVLLAKGGREFHIADSAAPIRNAAGEIVGVVLVFSDVTPRVTAELELAQYREHLEALVEERTQALTVAKDVAEAANRAKSTFLANMSHELRTPMNAIMGMTDLALRHTEDPKLQDQLSKVIQASRHLLAVINDILDISKIEADRLTLEAVSFKFGEVLENLMSLTGHRASEKHLKLLLDLTPEINHLSLLGDPLRLGQILLNLTGNALKFTEHGSITVRTRLLENHPDSVRLRIEVTDTGIGITPENQQHLFTAFEQADGSMTRKYGGTGLGLAISKRLTKLMGGEIGVDSVPGQGSTFWFTVRLSKATDAVLPAPTFSGQAADERLLDEFAGTLILLAEDEPINQEVSRGLLEDAGLAVDLAEDGVEAVALARKNRYALILMDMQMPNLNGIDATKAIRALPGYARTPILAMTANAFDEDRQVCLSAGMNDHIAKPVDPDKLFETLLKWLATTR